MSVERLLEEEDRSRHLGPAGQPPRSGDLNERRDAVGRDHVRLDVGADAVRLPDGRALCQAGACNSDACRGHRAGH
eukprot:11354552-Heterocapsa_arctica.AAC.1